MPTRVVLGTVILLTLASQPVSGASCQVAANLIPNCGFDSNVNSWTGSQTPTHEPNDGRTELGSANVVSDAGPAVVLISDCVAVSPNTVYGFGGGHRLISGAPNTCAFEARIFNLAGCTGGIANSGGLAFTPTGSWGHANSTVNTLAGVSARLIPQCFGDPGESFTLRFDDTFFGLDLVPVELQRLEVD